MRNKDGAQFSSENNRTIEIQEIEGATVKISDKLDFVKSLCHACMLFDSLLGRKDSVIVVITPLTAITKDRVFYLVIYLLEIL